MQVPVSLFIGLRYSQSRKGNAFLSFITLFSVAGIFLGVLALTVVSSVMNGFEGELKKRILGVIPHLIVQSADTTLPQRLSQQFPAIAQVSPFLQSEALIQSSKDLTGAMLQGVDVNALPTFLQQSLQQGDWQEFAASRYQVVLGSALADKLRVRLGQQIRLILPNGGSYTPLGWMPRQRNFTVAGIFDTGSEVDKVVVLLRLQDLQKLTGNKETAWRISLNDAFLAPELQTELSKLDGINAVTDWRQSHGKLFSAVAMEKAMMWLMLLLIVAVAAFNIVSALVMMVTEKQREVAILKTQGMTNQQLFYVFAAQGMSHGVTGALTGAVAGVLLTLSLNDLLALLGLQLVQGLALPVILQWSDVLLIMLSAVLLTALAVIYPAWRAVQVEPAAVLRDE
ncbi:lipoprotein-releasing ABC transporter permease subunit [Rheinheimera texasensis]|uniref:lipoprotein-releasing ABC transporter permease subunit n=1 Tax=Rheinheimera texasensis TaxID=306205 RepID=UPI0004E1868D|nr:lipoprotein-releasing ABC transporter permease subunit [Rheinheimera texasensis]